jgi:hypothetical protein
MFDSLEPRMDAGVLGHLQHLLTTLDFNNSGCMERLFEIRIYNKHWSGSLNLSKVHTLIHTYVQNSCNFKETKHKVSIMSIYAHGVSLLMK